MEDYTCMNGVLCCYDCNIIIFYLQCKRVGPECWKTMYNGGSWVPSSKIFMPRSLFANRLCDTWRDTPEQNGSSAWLGLGFTFHPTVICTLAHTYSVEEKITAAIKTTVDFGWIQSSGCLLHHQEIVDGIARSVTRISIPWWCKRRNRLLMKGSRQRATMWKMKILSHT